MKLVTFRKNSRLVVGVVTDRGIVDVANAVSSSGANIPYTYAEIIAAGNDELNRLREMLRNIPDGAAYLHDESTIEIGPPVIDPQKVICVGLNYTDHIKEIKLQQPTEPILFGKFANAVAGSGEDISVLGFEQVDYEAELAVVIGKAAHNVTVENALGHVFGYANANDLSERDLQFRSSQWLIGKSPDGFLPIGPYLVTADEIPDPQNLQIRGWMNGELRQDSNTRHMIFSVAQIISYASRFMTLLPGDVIATGTPPGVIMGTEEKVWMKAGDCYEVEITGLGRLSTCLKE